jgi:D-alanine transaminase
MTRLAWLNGVFLALDEARISPLDRGFLFADGVYEVTAVVNGRLVDMDRHLARLERSLRELGFDVLPDRAELAAMHDRLVRENAIEEGLIYLQVTRGAYAGRDFLPPSPERTRLTQFAFADARPLVDTPSARDGIAAAFQPDIRWSRRDTKTTQLLAPVLAKRAAREQGAGEAWLVAADGSVTEGASSNAWIVTAGGEIVTRSLSNDILPGVTRHAVMDAAQASQLRIVERAFTPAEAQAAVEAFITGAGSLVTPVVAIDGASIGSGRPGPITRRIQRLYLEAINTRLPDWLNGAGR